MKGEVWLRVSGTSESHGMANREGARGVASVQVVVMMPLAAHAMAGSRPGEVV